MPLSLGVDLLLLEQAQPSGPASVAGLLAWYKADALALSNGASVATWPDSSGNGFDATQATGADQPTFNTSQLNGLPAVTFNGTTDFLTATIPATNQPITLFAVLTAIGGGTFFDGGGNFNVYAQVQGGGGGNIRISGDGGATTLTYSPATVPATLYLAAVYNGASSLIRMNGSQVAAGTVGANSVGTLLTLGSAGSSSFSGTEIAELILYTGALSAPDVLTVEAYLNSKWFGGPGHTLVLSAAEAFTGSVAKSTGRTLAAGSLTAAGAIGRQTRKGLAATATLAGIVGRSTARAITSGLSAAGTTTKQTAKALQAASLTFAGTISRRTSRALAAAQLTLSGALASAKTGGSHAFTLTLSAALTASGVVQRQTGRALTAAQSFAGTVGKTTSRSLTAAASFAGSVGKQTGRGLAAAATLTGTVAKTTSRQLVAAISASGTLSSAAGVIRRALSAVASLTGSLIALLKPHAPGTVTSTVALLYQATGVEQLTASAVGTEALTASLTSTSPLTAAVASSEQPLASITSTVTVLQ